MTHPTAPRMTTAMLDGEAPARHGTASSGIVSILLAGGLGKRLWPLSRELHPKQLMALAGAESLLQEAARRALLVSAPDRVITVTTEALFLPVRDQLGEVDARLAGNVLLEPVGRNTAAAVAVAALHAHTGFGDPILFVAPSDHVVRDAQAVADAVRLAAQAPDRLVTFGIAPDRPETGYGYIVPGAPLHPHPHTGIHGADRFIEKPDVATARGLLAESGARWNSGMFVFRAGLVLDELAACAPGVHATVRAAYAQRRTSLGALRFPHALYEAIPAVPIDKAVMERTDKAAVIPIDPGWSDVGSWRKLWQASARDGDGNAVCGDAVLSGCRDTMVRGESRLIAAAGLNGVAICETADTVLVTALDADAEVGGIVESLRTAGREEAVRHPAERRPWGSFRVLLVGDGFKVKEITVQPGARLSLQSHRRRSEHWVVLEGEARVTCGDSVRDLGVNESTHIPVGARHRLENPGAAPLRIVEVQCGAYVGEDDIVRYEDAYGRTE